MKKYLNLIEDILENGYESDDRTGVGTKALFGRTIRFDLQQGFPILTTREMYFKGVLDELMWMLSGSTNVNDLPERTRQIWDQDEWMKDPESGDLGPSYGKQFRSVQGIHVDEYTGFMQGVFAGVKGVAEECDQVSHIIDNIKNNPTSRRHVISLWNQPDMENLNLPCCHGTKIQFNIRKCHPIEFLDFFGDDEDMIKEKYSIESKTSVIFDKYPQYKEMMEANSKNWPVWKIDCHMDARSQDVAIGMPWNIAFYAAFTHMIGQIVGAIPGDYIHTGGNCHIYKNHIDKLEGQLERNPYELPKLKMNRDIDDIDDFTVEDFELIDYNHHDKISFPIAV